MGPPSRAAYESDARSHRHRRHRLRQAALAFYRDALGLEVVGAARGRRPSRCAPTSCRSGQASLELLEATADDVGDRQVRRPGVAPAFTTSRCCVDDLDAALARSEGARRAADRRDAAARRPWLAGGVHPSVGRPAACSSSSSRPRRKARADACRRLRSRSGPSRAHPDPRRLLRLDGGAMFGVVPQAAVGAGRAARRPQPHPAGDAAAGWCAASGRDDPDRRRRRRQARRKGRRHLRLRSACRHSITSLADAGVARRRHRPRRSRRICISITPAASPCAAPTACVAPALSRARATSSGAGSGTTRCIRTSGTAPATSPDNYVPLLEAGVLDLVDERRGSRAWRARAPDRRAHRAPPDRRDRVGGTDGDLRGRPAADGRARAAAVHHGLRPLSDGHARVQARVSPEAVEREYLMLFEHDPEIAAGRFARRKRRAARGAGASSAEPWPDRACLQRRGLVACDRRSVRMQAEIGIIGGSGLYDMAELTDREE